MRIELRTCLYLFFFFAGVAAASEATVKREMEKKYPRVPVHSVTRTPMPGIYEVFMNGQIVYTDENVTYLIVRGRLIDVARRVDITEERMRVLTAVKFEDIPFEFAFPKVQGKGTRKLAYFADPNCPFCKKIEAEFANLDDVTIYIFLYPVLGQDSYEKAKAVWCSKDRVKAWNDMMLNGKAPGPPGNCDTPIEKILAFGQQQAITGTPTLFFSNGQRITGAVPADQLKKLLDAAR